MVETPTHHILGYVPIVHRQIETQTMINYRSGFWILRVELASHVVFVTEVLQNSIAGKIWLVRGKYTLQLENIRRGS